MGYVHIYALLFIKSTMADFLSVIESIRVGGDERSANLPSDADQNGSNKADTDNDIVVDEKELEEQVNDLVEIRKKDLLRKNLRNIVRENLMLKQKVKVLEARISSSIEESASASYNLLFRLDIDGDEVVDSEVALTEETAFILKDSTQELREYLSHMRRGWGVSEYTPTGAAHPVLVRNGYNTAGKSQRLCQIPPI